MPEITEITATYNRKVQLQQFEPVSHGVEVTASLGDGEDPDEAYDDLSEQAEDMVERQLAARIAQQKLESDDDDG